MRGPRYVLRCHPLVWALLRKHDEKAFHAMCHGGPLLPELLAAEVRKDPDMQPGEWKFFRNDEEIASGKAHSEL